MKIRDLKKILESYPDEMLVLVQGYEGGFSEIGDIRNTLVELNHYEEEWNGPHEETEKADTKAIILMRKRN